MLRTLDLDQLTQYVDSVYEAIVVIARRARQINDEQRLIYEKYMDYDDMSEDFEEDDYGRQGKPKDNIKLPKPPSLALEEYLKGELQREYAEESTV